MVGKAVVSVISIILVVGVVIGVVAVVHHQGNSKSSGGGGDENISASMKTVDALCAPAMYKGKCVESLGPVAQNQSATPQDYIRAGVKLALEEITKAFNLTGTLVPKVNGTENPSMTKMAVDDCHDLLDYAVQKINLVFNQVGDPKIYQEQMKTWDLRLWLSEVITYQENCMDGLQEAKAPELQKIMENGMVNGTQLTMSVLDMITYFNDALGQLGFDLNTTKLIDGLKSGSAGAAGSRRLLGMPMAADGTPGWMAAADRKLLGVPKGANPMGGLTPHAIVAKDGSGTFRTIMEAVNAYNPMIGAQGRFVIYVKAGVYDEEVLINKKQVNILMYGDGHDKTIVTGKKSFASGYVTSKTATFAVQGDGFLCKNMGFENTAGPEGHQAVAMRINAERVVFHNCAFLGFQDTLYPQGGSQFFSECIIAGTIDFIFGNGATVIQNSQIIARLPSATQFNAITAQGRKGPNMPTGIVIQNCNIFADPALEPRKFVIKSYLGRPWKAYARTIYLENDIGDFIDPLGWKEWQGDLFLNTIFYAEYRNRGKGAVTAAHNTRVKWGTVKILETPAEANPWTAGIFLPGGQLWLRESGVPHTLGLMA